jgi:hypothetical protein
LFEITPPVLAISSSAAFEKITLVIVMSKGLRDFGKVASIKQYLPSQQSLPIGGASAADLCQPKVHLTLFL